MCLTVKKKEETDKVGRIMLLAIFVLSASFLSRRVHQTLATESGRRRTELLWNFTQREVVSSYRRSEQPIGPILSIQESQEESL
jgi:hypothetical protein